MKSELLFFCLYASSNIYWCVLSLSMAQNNLHELWSLLNFLLPEIFSSAETFDEWFQISGENDEHEVVQQLHKVSLEASSLLRVYCDKMLYNNVFIFCV